MRTASKSKNQAFTLVEILVAAGLLALTTVVMTQAMLVLNRNAAVARVRNLAKAVALSRIQEVAAVKFDPAADPAIVPTPLVVTTDPGPKENITLGDSTTGLGALPGTLQWTVKKDANEIRTVNCRVEYTYLGRLRNYEVVTFRSPD